MAAVVQYMRAVYDFHASHPNEVSLRKGDIVQITKRLDANWLHGTVRRVEGAFPINFVEPLSIPRVETGQKVFAAIENFDVGEAGDLCLHRGDVVIGTGSIDQNWWQGYAVTTGESGIFPLTHMEELTSESGQNPPPHPLQDKDSSPAVSVLCEARVISSLHAQLEYELDLTEGESVEILQFLDDGFAFGRCRGKTGQFPLSFVQMNVYEPDNSSDRHCSKQSDEIPTSNCDSNFTACVQTKTDSVISNNGYLKGKKSHSRKGSYTQANTRSHDSCVMPYAQACYSFTAVNEGELSFSANEIITLVSHIDDDWAEGEINGKKGIFPTSYVNIIVDCQPTEDSRLVARAAGEDSSPEVYGRVLYDFNVENSEELSLCEGDTVTILEQLDADWYLAKHDDERVGRCPVSYIEVFGCEPLHGVTTPSSAHPDQNRSQMSPAVDRFSLSCTNIKPKPAVKPKPKLNSSVNSDCGQPATSPEGGRIERNSSKIISEGVLPDRKKSGDSRQLSKSQKHHSNARMSLDEDVQRELFKVREKSSAKENQNAEAFVSKHRNSTARPQSVSFLGFETPEPFRPKQDFNGTYVHHQTSKSPVPAPRILRPNSLGVTVDSTSLIVESSNYPTAPLRPSGSEMSPARPKMIPRRPAPPCPVSRTSMRSQSHNDLMMFSPDRLASADHPRSSTPMMNLPTTPVQSRTSNADPDSTQTDGKHHEKRKRVIAELIQTESDFVNSLVLCLKTFSSRAKLCPPALDLEMLFGNADEVVELSQRLLGLIDQNVETKPFEMQCVGKCFLELKDQFQRVYAPYCRNHDNVIALLEKYESNAEISEFIQSALNQIRQQLQVFDLHSILIKPVQRILKYPLLLSELERVTDEGHADKCHLLTAISTMTNIAAYINEYKRRKDLVFKYKQETDVKFSDKISRLTMHSTMKKLSRISRKMVGIQTVDESFNLQEQRFKALDNAIRNLTRDISQYIEQCQEVLECREIVAGNVAEFYMTEAPELEIQKFCEVHNHILRALFHEFKEEAESNVLPPLNSLLLMYQGPHKVIRKRYDKLLDYDNAAARQRNAGDSDQAKALDEELTIARNNYEALNAQLLDDLPKLYTLSMEILLKCLKWFISIQNRFLRNAVDKLHSLLRLPLLLGSSSCPNIIETFNIAHAIAVEKVSHLSFITKSFNPQVDEVRKMKDRRSTVDGIQRLIDIDGGSNQCDGQRIQLKQKYSAECLFWVCRDFVGEQTMDLTLSAGALVAVIKEGDPMGNRDRWFVDNGVEKGFVPKEFLSDKPPSSSVMPQKAVDLLDWLDPAGPSESKSSMANDDVFMRLDSNILRPTSGASSAQALNLTTSKKQSEWVKCDDSSLFSDQSSMESVSSNFNSSRSTDISSDVFYRAVYEFSARNRIELSIRNGEIVRVHQKHDLDGSKEWWLAERDDGQKGYVPANYLYAVNYS